MLFLDPNDPRTTMGIVSGQWALPSSTVDTLDPEDREQALMALDVASEMLFRLSGYLIHPAGLGEEDFIAHPRATRLTPTYLPLRSVLGVNRMLDYGTDAETGMPLDCTAQEIDSGWCVYGQAIHFSTGRCSLGTWMQSVCGCLPQEREVLRVCYQFGSTVTAGARRAVIQLAYQLYLEANPDVGECQLPERTTNVNREGISYTIYDPQTFLDQRRTGLSSVDLWLSSVNPAKALRPSGVWTPDMPPPVNRCVRWTRPLFPPAPVPSVEVVPAP